MRMCMQTQLILPAALQNKKQTERWGHMKILQYLVPTNKKKGGPTRPFAPRVSVAGSAASKVSGKGIAAFGSATAVARGAKKWLGKTRAAKAAPAPAAPVRHCACVA